MSFAHSALLLSIFEVVSGHQLNLPVMPPLPALLRYSEDVFLVGTWLLPALLSPWITLPQGAALPLLLLDIQIPPETCSQLSISASSNP